MEKMRPKIKLKGAANNKAADSVDSERSQDQLKGVPVNPDANAGQEGFFPVLTGGIKRKRGPRAGERRAKEKQRFTFSRGSAVPSVVGDEEEFSDQDENESKEDIEVNVKMINQRQVTTASNGLITESVEIKGAQSFQQKQGHLKVRVKASKLHEGSNTPERQKVNDNENANSSEAPKECQKPDLKQLEKPSNLMLKAARPLDQPSAPRQSRSSKSNEMASSPNQNETEKLPISSEIQEKNMVEVSSGPHQRHRRQSHAVGKGQSDQSHENAGRKVRRPDCTLATTDHNVPTTSRKALKDIASFIEEDDSRTQCVTLEENVKKFGVTYFGLGDKRQGIVHIIGPEQGFTLPGTTVVCGDSHTSTHGAFGALAFGIGTSEVEHVLATQCLITKRSKNMRIQIDGELAPGVSSKDVVLHAIGRIGTAGGTGAVIEFCGSVIRNLSMEARMSICNMSIEGGARAGMVAPDEITFEYLKGRPLAPKYGSETWNQAVAYWKSLQSDPGAKYDIDVFIDAKDIIPTITWGTSPEDVVPITGCVPDPETFSSESKKAAGRRMLEYMGLTAGTPMEDIPVDKVFIGSCTNARIEDLRAAANVVKGRKVADNIKRAMVVPGSGLVKAQAEEEGLDQIFVDAGFEWREAGCSMCLGMNPDILAPKERCASTSNRNFEGRQGALSRTHLMSPVMAAAAAIVGKLADVRKLSHYTHQSAFKPRELPVEEPHVDERTRDDSEEREMIGDQPQDSQPHTNTLAGAAGAASGLPKFTIWKGTAAPLDRSNVDTDAIIPKQFLKTIKRTGLGTALFYELRYKEDGSENPDFILNQEPFRQAKTLVVTGPNFGCGSSREHAPWALLDFGIKCIIAPSFADIFFNNTFKNGMLPIRIENKDNLEAIAAEARANREIEIDLPNQLIKNADGETICSFDVEEFRKHCLVNGLDDIGLTMQQEDKIAEFERRMTQNTPWLDGTGYLKRPGQGGKLAAKAVPVPKTNRGEEKKEPLEW